MGEAGSLATLVDGHADQSARRSDAEQATSAVDREVGHPAPAGHDLASRAGRSKREDVGRQVATCAVEHEAALTREHDDQDVDLSVDVLPDATTGVEMDQVGVQVTPGGHAPVHAVAGGPGRDQLVERDDIRRGVSRIGGHTSPGEIEGNVLALDRTIVHDGGVERERSAPPDDRLTLQIQAKALGDPTRHRIFRHVADAGRPVDVIELTAALGLHHNAVRQHLAKLVDAGLLIEGTAPASGRGRPRLQYTPAPDTDSRWGVVGPYERLSLLLAEIIHTGDPPPEVGRRAGRRAHLERKPVTRAADPVGAFVDEMAHQGFDPVALERGSDVAITLRSCPFATTALADPGTVCGLHLGIAHGIAEAIGGLAVDELIPFDPRRAHCELHGHLTR